MKTLQEILNDFNGSKIATIKEAKISHMIGADRATKIRLELLKLKRQKKENTPIDPFLIEEMKMVKQQNKEMRSRNGKILGLGKGTEMLKIHGARARELSKVPVVCPNCNTVGPLSNMKQFHFDKCLRTQGYSNEVIISKYKSGVSCSTISKESGISYGNTKLIVRKWKASNNI
jgi:hypothetical protein